MFSEDSFSTDSFSVDSFLFDLIERVEQATAGFIRKRKRFKQSEPPTEEQIRAERIRLGIIESRQERTRVLKRVKGVEKGSQQAQQLQLYAYLLKQEISRLQAEYEALRAELEAQGALIRSKVITSLVMAMIDEELKLAQKEEDDVMFLLTMFTEI